MKEPEFIPSESRGKADHGWLKAAHSFSFAGYYAQDRIHFGALRVLNDDLVAPDKGFGMHPHDNMEIITIPLEGALAHKDSMGNEGIIQSGDIQVMSAGTGVYHSEYNASSDRPVSLLQIWVFPNQRQVNPRYDQRTFTFQANTFTDLVGPMGSSTLEIYQDSWFSMFVSDKTQDIVYSFHKNNMGCYAFVIEGSVSFNAIHAKTRDAFAFYSDTSSSLTMQVSPASRILFIEVPLTW
jgi:redox-sensitive bicupin YhaK (pirin superfamily)